MPATHDRWDPIPLLEALYALEQPRELWIAGVLDAAGKALDRGCGVGMLLYDVSGAEPRIEALEGFNVAPENLEIGTSMHALPGWADAILHCYRTAMCATLDEHVPDREMRATMRDRYRSLDICDQILINGANHSGFGCGLYVFSPTVVELSTQERQQLVRLASHLSTAYRLHRRLVRTARDNTVEAVEYEETLPDGSTLIIPRPTVDAGAFAPSHGTRLTVVSFSEDRAVHAADVKVLYEYLTGDDDDRFYRSIVSPNAVHCMLISDPEELLSEFQGD